MSSTPILSAAKRVTFLGLKAAHGVHAARGPAHLAARVPVIGPILGLGVLATGAIAGAVHAITEYDGD